MGTRGFYGVVIDGDVKITYNHFDSYPDGLGSSILKQVKYLMDDPAEFRKMALAMLLVNEDSKPTPEQIANLKGFHDSTVSTGEPTEWYSLLRNMQGDLAANLSQGVMIDSGEFPLDSLFCEWGYLVDLDEGVFEVYQGFQKQAPTEGRWAGRPNAEDDQARVERADKALEAGEINERQYEFWVRPTEYFAVQRVATYPLSDLPAESNFTLLFSDE
jgi:hypothetical protein